MISSSSDSSSSEIASNEQHHNMVESKQIQSVSSPIIKGQIPSLEEMCQKVVEDDLTMVIPVKVSGPDNLTMVIPLKVCNQSITKRQVPSLKNLCKSVVDDYPILAASKPEVVSYKDSQENELDLLNLAVINAQIEVWNTEDGMDVDESAGATDPMFSDDDYDDDDDDTNTQPSQTKGGKEEPKDESAKLLSDAQQTFATRISSASCDPKENNYDHLILGPANMKVPVVKPLQKSNPKPELPDKIAFYIGIDKVDRDREKTLRMMTKENLILANLKLSEALHHKSKMQADDNAMLARLGDHEIVQNPIVRARELCGVNAALIYRPESELHKRRIIVHAAGEWPLEDYNLVEILSFKLIPTGRHLWIPSVEILQVPDTNFEDTVKENLREKDKEIAKLKEEIKKAKQEMQNKIPAPIYDPKAEVELITDGGQHPILQDSAGTENPRIVKEKQHLCTLCGKRFVSKNSLSNHVLKLHGGKDGKATMKKCDRCDQEFKYNDYYKTKIHRCWLEIKEEQKRKKKNT